MAAEKSAREQRMRGRPFRKGESGNPSGKPPGTRNRSSLMMAAIEEGDLAAIIRTTVNKAKAGDLAAAKLILDRLVPAPKNRAVPVALPVIGQWDGAETVLQAYRAVIDAVAAAQISPAEALDLSALIEAHRTAVKDLRPYAMGREPTPEEIEVSKRRSERMSKLLGE